jgi:hypothetical protein
VGSPLAVTAIRRSLAPLHFPDGVGTWFNARDPRDLVALHPLDGERFPIEPGVENFDGVTNQSPNRHGIDGYLSDPTVSRLIHSAMTA